MSLNTHSFNEIKGFADQVFVLPIDCKYSILKIHSSVTWFSLPHISENYKRKKKKKKKRCVIRSVSDAKTKWNIYLFTCRLYML